MAAAGRPYRGVLYAGLMITDRGPKVLEYNARFGDPEAQPILARLESDLLPLLEACIDGTLAAQTPVWRDDPAVCIVLASGGYPGRYATGLPISGLAEAGREPGVTVFHAGTAERDGRIVTAGGRVLGVTATGPTIAEAIARGYRAVDRISFEGMHCRRDIGHRALARGEGKP
jgi:phosphoribosylamine--glycine ligase